MWLSQLGKRERERGGGRWELFELLDVLTPRLVGVADYYIHDTLQYTSRSQEMIFTPHKGHSQCTVAMELPKYLH